MKLLRLQASKYKSIYDDSLTFGPLNLLIGANASGKSNILDATRFLSEGVRDKTFEHSVSSRGGIIHLAWKGEQADEISLITEFEDELSRYSWTVELVRSGTYGFSVRERVFLLPENSPRVEVLEASDGEGWWWSNAAQKQVPLEQAATACALAAAAADATFPARALADFIQGWRFFDPSPALLRRASAKNEGLSLEPTGANLAARLYTLKEQSPKTFKHIVDATRSVLGIPKEVDFRDSEDRLYLLFSEPGLDYRVHQIGASSGTLRMLAMMTALFGETSATLVGIEEPENHVHPSALHAYADHLRAASEQVQVVVSTHSPLLLTYLGDPSAVCFVRRTATGTKVEREANVEAVREALTESAFGLGEFYETKGFGA